MNDASQGHSEHPPRGGGQPASAGDDTDPLYAGIGEICDTAMLRAGADGAALAVLTRSAGSRELIYATDTLAEQLDELQYTLGEGPCFDAYLDDRAQSHPELTSVAQTSQWPTFAAGATQLGVHALFAFPIPDGQRPMGVLELYRHSAGILDGGERGAVVTCAAMIAQRLLSNWEDQVARLGGVEQALDAAAFSDAASPFTHTQIHVAGGMIAIQLDINPDEGVDRLRAYSYATGRRLSSVAADIIARRLALPA